MKRLRVFAPLLLLISLTSTSSDAVAATPSSFVGGGWTLTLTYSQTANGQVMAGTFHSSKKSFRVAGDWIPAGDAGSDLLRFYGHPFGQRSPIGLVGVATLANTCNPYCAASTHYRLREVPNLITLRTTLPGVGRASLVLRLRVH